MSVCREEVRAFSRALSAYILTVNGSPEIEPNGISTLYLFEDALRRHENALTDLVVLENGETDADKQWPLSKYLYRGLRTSARIIYAIRDWCGEERDPAGVLRHRFEAAFLGQRIIQETLEQQTVIYDNKIANNSLW